MRLGESLIARGLVDPAGLARALDEQRLTQQRIGSLLIARGLADADDVARALGEQHGVPAALARHLANRDHALAALLSPEYARANVLLPIGRARGGELIVCARDPRPLLIDPLEDMVDGIVMLAVAPADAIDALVAAVYGTGASDDFDVDLETGPVDRISADGLDQITSGAFTLVGLDDARVTKDPTQSGAILIPGGRATTPSTPPRMRSNPPRTPTLPPPIPVVARPPALPVSPPIIAVHAAPAPADLDGGWAIGDEPLPAPPRTLAQSLDQLAHTTSRDAATDVVMAYLAVRWTAALLFTIKDGAALGHRGHGQPSPDAIASAMFPLTAPSLLKLAHDSRALANDPPPGAATIQERLARLLAQPRAPAVAPIAVGPRVVGLIAVGDAVIAPGDGRASSPTGSAAEWRRGSVDAHDDLDSLAAALGAAYARILRDGKRALEP